MKKIVFLTILIVLTAGCIEKPLTSYQKKFAGLTLNFRANLTEAEKVLVEPDENALRNVLLNYNAEEFGIAYIPNETENAYYLAASYELAYKLTIINKYYFNRVKFIDSIPVNNITEAFLIAKEEKPIILLLGESQTNLTAVKVFPTGYVVIAYGGNFSEIDRKYNDLDLAVDKILLVLMSST
ncbi:MAG: hypothetical protein QXD43_00395 [Candidatus Aenigmatarchaeota archaeon]